MKISIHRWQPRGNCYKVQSFTLEEIAEAVPHGGDTFFGAQFDEHCGTSLPKIGTSV